MSYDVGAGGHLSFDMGLNIGHKIIKWKDVVKFVSSASQESKQLQKFFGWNDKNINNAQAIIKNYFVNMTTSLINKRISDLNNKNAQNAETIKNANEYLGDYKKSSGLYKFFNSLVKKQAEAEKNEAQKDIEKNNLEKITLQKTKIKFE